MSSMSESLFAWVGTLSPFTQRKAKPTTEDFKDGVMLSKILKEVVDSEFFKDLKTSSTDATPLIHLNMRMLNYLSEQVGHTLPSSVTPNIPRIMTSGDVGEISRLLQLLLVCSVNSPRREEFIKNIRNMEMSVQTEIVSAIQEIMDAKDVSSATDDDIIEMQLKKARGEAAALRDDKERLSQQCHEITQKLSQLKVEKSTLLAENEKLQSQLAGTFNDPESLHMSSRIQEENKKEIELLRERNYELEAIVDDFKVKNQVLQKQISETHFKMASAASAEEEVNRLKDEMDSLRELAAKASHYEKQMKVYQKKLEEMADLKQTARLLEEKNTEMMKSNFSLLDENKKIQNFKNQIDALKKDLTETQQALSQEKHKANKANFDCNKTREKLDTLKGQNEALQEEKTHLAEIVEELRLTSGGASSDGTLTANMTGSSDYSIELLPPSVRQKLIRLELENKKLQDDLKSAISNDPSFEGSKILVEQLRKHEEELDKELLAKNQELIDSKSAFNDRICRLEAIIATKDEDLKRKEIQYKKCMEKAQSVIKTLEPTSAPGIDGVKSEEMEKARSVREMEDKLLQSAFYHYGIALHHKAVETRNRTFLGQHRQSVASRRRSDLP